MPQIPGIIHHKPLLEIIEAVNKPRWGKLFFKHTSENRSGYIKPADNQFTIQFNIDHSEKSILDFRLGKVLKTTSFSTDRFNLIFEDFFIGSFSLPKIKASVTRFRTKGFGKLHKYYHRLVIPLRKELSFFFQIENSGYHSDLGYRSSMGLTVSIDNDFIYGCVFHSKKKQYYLSVESRTLQNWHLFSDKAYAFINSLGFMSGHLAGDKGYFFSYTRRDMAVPKQFYFTDFRPTIVKRYVPINTNPYAFVRNRRAAENYFKKKTLRKLSASEFSLLCQKTFANSDFDTCLILILESCASSLAVMPGGLAICLESISDIIIKDKSKSIKPIKDKELAKKIIDECIEVINSHKRELDLNGVETLIKKLQQLNQPTNKDRLRTPFEILGIELLPEDIKVLQARNDLLHGRFPKFNEINGERSLDRINRDLYYTAMRLYTLLSMLILKWVGFDNFVLNHPVIQQNGTKYKLKEAYYRENS